MKKHIYLWIAGAFMLSSCIKEIEFEGELIKPRLVVNGFVTPDSLVQVNVSHSLNILDIASIQPLQTASVKLYDGNGNFLEDLTHTSGGNYVSPSNRIAQSGDSYRIAVAAAGYDAVTSSTSVPAAVPVLVTDTATIQLGETTFFRTRFRLNDPAGKGDQYVIRLYSISEYINYDMFGNPLDTVTYLSPEYVSSTSVYVEESGEVYDTREMLFSRDALYDGQSVEMDAYVYNAPYQSGSRLMVMVFRATEEFYRHQNSFMKYNFSSGDPFAQPVQIYSNIDQGIGIFAGYAVTTVMVY